MKLGYHISISDGLIKTAEKIKEQKMTAVQIFPGSPRNYFPGKKHTIYDYIAMSNLNIPKFVHINYFVNLCGEKEIIQKSIAENMLFCDRIGAEGLVIHMGSEKNKAKGMSQTILNLKFAKEKFLELNSGIEPRVKILIETTAEGGQRLKWKEMLELLELMPELGMVIDTCHLYSAGYTADEICKMIEENHKLVGLVHLNNPSPNVEIGKHKDQHDIPLFSEEGKFSKIEIENFMNICKLYDISCVTETGDEEEELKLIIENYRNF